MSDDTLFINLTPHAVVVRVGDMDVVYPPSGRVARVEQIDSPAPAFPSTGRVKSIPCIRRSYGSITDWPYSMPVSAVYIVSAQVASALVGSGLPYTAVVPDNGSDAIRDASGQIIAVRRFIRAE